MQITLELTEKEAGYLVAACNEFFQKMKSSYEDSTYGALITEDRVLAARSLWRKTQEQVGIE